MWRRSLITPVEQAGRARPEAPRRRHGVAAEAAQASEAETPDRRYHAFDNLRAWMLLLLIPFHAALPFMTVPSVMHFNDPDPGVFYDGLALLLLSFRRPLFFVVGGFFAAMLLERRGLRGMLDNRARRILLPLILGWIVLSPATHAAYDFAVGAARQGTLRGGLRRLQEGDWIDWERPFHLWFLVALMIFYGAALALRAWLPRVLGSRWTEYEVWTRRLLASRWRAAFLSLPLIALLVPSEFLPYNRGNPFLALALALFFGLGWRLYAHRDLLAGQARGAWMHAVLGLALLPLVTWAKWNLLHGSPGRLAWGLTSGISGAVMSALLVCGVMGIFLRHADDRSPVLRYISDSSYWVYLAHMPVVVAIGGALATTELSASAKFWLAVAATAAVTLASYALCVRETWIGLLLNGHRSGAKLAGKSV